MGLRWLITGGCGFLGTSLIRRLVDEGGHAVRVVDNLTVGTRDDLSNVCGYSEPSRFGMEELAPLEPGTCELVVGDILDENLAVAAARGIDVIVHLAANTGVAPSVEDPRQDCVTNVIGTLNYLEAARFNKVERFVFASSGAPVGEVVPPIHEEMAAHPVSPYGASKLAGEGYCSAYFRTFGIQTVALRFGNVYGPNSAHKSSVVAKFIRQAVNKEVLEIYGEGKHTRDFIYIDDLVRAIKLAATKENIGGEVFQIATNSETTMDGLVSILVPVLEDVGIADVVVKYGVPRQGDVLRNYSDTSKASRVLQWEPQTDLVTGIKQTVRWFVPK